jgi:hypothetical protein
MRVSLFRRRAAKPSAHHDGQVQAVLKEGAFALVVLDGAHDRRSGTGTAHRVS